MAGVTVRQSTPADVAGIQRIARRGWEAAYGEFLADATIESLVTDLARVAPLLASDLRFPNPMGLPEPDAPAT